MPSQLPAQDSAFFNQLIDLDEVTFTLTYRYNTRETAWYFDIAQQDGTVIVGGQKLLPAIDLTSRWADPRMPAGQLLTISDFPNQRPSRDALFSGEFKIIYVTAAEVEELEALNASTV